MTLSSLAAARPAIALAHAATPAFARCVRGALNVPQQETIQSLAGQYLDHSLLLPLRPERQSSRVEGISNDEMHCSNRRSVRRARDLLGVIAISGGELGRELRDDRGSARCPTSLNGDARQSCRGRNPTRSRPVDDCLPAHATAINEWLFIGGMISGTTVRD
jgi:hypothetical protein